MTTTTTTTIPRNDDYIVTTATHNYISRSAHLKNAQYIELRGRSVIQDNVCIQGEEMAPIRIGRFTHIQAESTIVPPSSPYLTTTSTTSEQLIPVSIGSHTWIGTHVHSKAAAIGSYCYIGNHVQLGERVLLKDAVIVQNHATIPADTVVPPFTYIKVNGEWEELPPAITVELQERSKQYYQQMNVH